MKVQVYGGVLAATFACVLAACSGGTPVTPPASTPAQHSGQVVPVSFTLLVPRVNANASRRSQYVSLGTKSATVNQVGMNVSANSPNCTAVTGGLACTMQIKVSPGPQYLTVTTYDQPLKSDGTTQGNQLSTGSAAATIVEGQANTVSVTLAGTPAKAAITLSNPNPPMGVATTIPMTINVEDAAGYTIVGPFSAQVELTATTSQLQSSANIAFQVNGQTTSWLSAPSDAVALVYSGSGVRSATIGTSLQFGGTLAGTVSFAPVPSFASEITVGTSLVNAEAYADTSYQHLIYFTEPAKAKVAIYTPGSGVQDWAVPSGGSPERLSYGGLGTLSFTESNNNIGSFYNMGASIGGNPIVEHTLTNANAGAYVVRGTGLGPSQYISEKSAGGFAVPTTGDPLAGYTPGPDAFYTSGASGSAPAGMGYDCAGATVSFWLADSGANEIDCVTVTGSFTRHAVPSLGARPTEVTDFDQTKYWWFTEPGVSKIASIDASANITEYPSPGVPKAICADQYNVVVLTTTGNIEVYDESTGALTGTYTPPASSNGPAVWIDAAGTFGSVLVLRSDGTHGSIQTFSYD